MRITEHGLATVMPCIYGTFSREVNDAVLIKVVQHLVKVLTLNLNRYLNISILHLFVSKVLRFDIQTF